MARSRSFCFTLNNYTDEEVESVKAWDCKYLIFGKEVGDSGTPHLQGFVSFTDGKTLSSLKKYSKRAHWEVARGTPKQASQYCRKEGDVFEKGTPPKDSKECGKAEQERWRTAFEAVRDKRWDDVPADILCRHLKTIEYAVSRTCKTKPETLDYTTRHIWIWGPPGTGKSLGARNLAPEAYIKDPKDRWWDNYAGEEDVIIDDFDKFQVQMSGDLKRWLDIYPFQAPVKGGYSLIRPKRIIITSNYSPDQIWNDEVTVQAIGRRCDIHYWNPIASPEGSINGPLPWHPQRRICDGERRCDAAEERSGGARRGAPGAREAERGRAEQKPPPEPRSPPEGGAAEGGGRKCPPCVYTDDGDLET